RKYRKWLTILGEAPVRLKAKSHRGGAESAEVRGVFFKKQPPRPPRLRGALEAFPFVTELSHSACTERHARKVDAEVRRVLRRLRRPGRRHGPRREAALRTARRLHRRRTESAGDQGSGAPRRRDRPPRLRAPPPPVHHALRPRRDPPLARPHRRRARLDRRHRRAPVALRG